jgi:hypothetical protein
LEVVYSSTVSKSELHGNQLVIGKVLWRTRNFSVDAQYVPACAVTAAHPVLLNRYSEIEKLQNTLRKAAIDIVQNIHLKASQNRPDYDPELARNTAKLSTVIVDYLADGLFAFKNTFKSSPPILIVEYVSRLAGRLSAVLSLMPGAERERLLTYYSQWTNIQPMKFSADLNGVAEVQFDHLNLEISTRLALEMMNVLTGLWSHLSGLEFIGKTGDNLVMGVNNEHRNHATTRHSVLD